MRLDISLSWLPLFERLNHSLTLETKVFTWMSVDHNIDLIFNNIFKRIAWFRGYLHQPICASLIIWAIFSGYLTSLDIIWYWVSSSSNMAVLLSFTNFDHLDCSYKHLNPHIIPSIQKHIFYTKIQLHTKLFLLDSDFIKVNVFKLVFLGKVYSAPPSRPLNSIFSSNKSDVVVEYEISFKIIY